METRNQKGLQASILEAKSAFSAIDIVNSIVADAYRSRASDVHLNPTNDSLRIRLRIDGVLKNFYSLPKDFQQEIVCRVKIMAGLRTDQQQSVQDGRFRSIVGDKEVDVRVSVVPSYYGENIVMRLLVDNNSEDFSLDSLAFAPEEQEKIVKAIHQQSGMILVTGPTGSGKTTTLYTLIKMLNKEDISIVTIEDPVECAIPNVEQIPVNPRTGLTFANGLKSILRQDPNVIMVGEIRDTETASIAVNTALTGHLMLSTLHTNDSVATLPRLLDMGIESYLVSSTISLIIGQRLVRKICSDCKEKVRITTAEKKSLTDALGGAFTKQTKFLYRGRGCESCKMIGYKGRVGIHEVLVADKDIKEAILKKASVDEIRTIAIEKGMKTMLEDGLVKAASGLTTIEEVLKAVHE